MRNFLMKLVIVMILVALNFATSFAQLPWTKHANNPVLTGGAKGTWNEHIYWPFVLYNADSSRYEMWFTAGAKYRPFRIGFATSPDGVTWEMYPDPVLQPDAGSWDESSSESAMVIRENGEYKMWYSGWSPSNEVGGLGYATSKDGINWNKDTINSPVLVPDVGAWEAGGYGKCHVISFAGGYKMWYTAGNADWSHSYIGYAASSDGINWIKEAVNNPVLKHGSHGQWDDGNLDLPHVMLIDSLYHMWYSGRRLNQGGTWQTGWASSTDGIQWKKYNNPATSTELYSDSDPVLKPTPGQWDGNLVLNGSVIYREADSLFQMWYGGIQGDIDSYPWRIGYATSTLSFPDIIRVPGDIPTIQAAIDSASDGNLVLVADGIYKENINYKGKAITVASHYYLNGDTSHISNTIIDGSNPSNPDSGSVVYFVSGEDTNSVLYGFTITNGSGTKSTSMWQNEQISVRAGGGILCYNSGGRIVHNIITNNHITSSNYADGGGVAGYPNGSKSYIIIESNQITHNNITAEIDALGSAVELTCNGSLINNRISHNSSTAKNIATGAITCWSEKSPNAVSIKNNKITQNKTTGEDWAIGSGIDIEFEMQASIIANDISFNELHASNARCSGIHVVFDARSILIDKNRISNNVLSGTFGSGGGIALYENSGNTLLTNNIISGNSAIDGGGIDIRESKTQIINNTIVNNKAFGSGGALRLTNIKPVVFNTIIWGNQAGSNPQISGSVEIQYSDVEGGIPGTGNFNLDPMFEDTLDFKLMKLSPCAGTGIDSLEFENIVYYAPPFDFFGDTRPFYRWKEEVDVGAVESSYPNPIDGHGANGSVTPVKFALQQNYPNPFNPKTVISWQLPVASKVDLSVFNLLGQKVATLVSKRLNAGQHQTEWDATGFASGVYLYRIETDNGFIQTRKLILLK